MSIFSFFCERAKSQTNPPREKIVDSLTYIGQLRSEIAVLEKVNRNQIELHVNSYIADDDSERIIRFMKGRNSVGEINATIQNMKVTNNIPHAISLGF